MNFKLLLSILLFAGLSFSQEVEQGAPELLGELEPYDGPLLADGVQLKCPDHVEVLAATIENQQIQIATLKRRLSELLFERESLLLSQAVNPQSEAYSSSIRKALTAAGADPERCRIEDLISGKITCQPPPAAANE